MKWVIYTNLFAKVLCYGISHLLTKGLDRGYVLHKEETGLIRGKINFTTTLRKNFFNQPQIDCEYDEFRHDVLHNQMLKSTVQMLIRCEDLNEKLRDELKYIYHRLHGIEEINLSKRCFRLVQLNRNNFYWHFPFAFTNGVPAHYALYKTSTCDRTSTLLTIILVGIAENRANLLTIKDWTTFSTCLDQLSLIHQRLRP